jgi:Chaperone of endosialidase
MAATTTLLGLVTPTQGTLSGTWGDTVNYGISDYLDIAIAGTLSFAGDGAITLANTTGSSSGNAITSTTAQYMVIRITGTQTVAKVITGPSYSKLYMVDHAGATSAVTFKASGQTGVSIAVGEKCFVYYNGTDYVKIAGSVDTGVTSFTAGTTGFTPSTATTGAVTLAGTLATTNGGTGRTAYTANSVLYASSTSVIASGSALTFDGTNISTSGLYVSSAATGRLSKSASTGRNVLTGGITGGTTDGAYVITEGYDYGGTGLGGVIQLVTAGASSPITFAINGTEGMRLNTTGLGIGTSSPSVKLDISSTASRILNLNSTSANGYGMAFNNSGTDVAFIGSAKWNFAGALNDMSITTVGAYNLCFGTNSTEKVRISSAGGFSVGTTADPGVGAIYATGNITAYYSSDIKFKENVRDIPDALATVNAIGGKLFDWKDDYIESKGGADGYFVQKADFGVVAQDVQKVFPIAVRTREDGSLAVDYEKLGALAFAAVGELTALVQTLATRVKALEAK